jgi:hypothetical protein
MGTGFCSYFYQQQQKSISRWKISDYGYCLPYVMKIFNLKAGFFRWWAFWLTLMWQQQSWGIPECEMCGIRQSCW